MALNIPFNSFDAKWVGDIIPILAQAYKTQGWAQYGAMVAQSINSRWAFAGLDVDAELQAFDSCPTSFGDVTWSQFRQPTCEVSMLVELSHQEWINTYEADAYSRGVLNRKVWNAKDFWTSLVSQMLAKFVDRVDGLNTTGPGYNAGLQTSCPDYGLLPQLRDSALVLPVDGTGTGTAITPANVIQTMMETRKTLPSEVRERAGNLKPKYAVSPDVYEAYLEAYMTPRQTSGTGISGTFGAADPTTGLPKTFFGFEVYVHQHLPASTIILTYPQNIVMAFDTVRDLAQLKVVDLSQYSMCEKAQMQVAAAVGITARRFEHIALYQL